MQMIQHPSKEQVRAYLAQRIAQRRQEDLPPPTPDEIRRQLGWSLCPHSGYAGALTFPSSVARLSALLCLAWFCSAFLPNNSR
ncbi:hypothetical protein [Massilia sp. YIM B04103]|uniref:hypothetical protein n=1 Tax=Massilia sp. YIM B04103 TaxID=2963106 RepID=UPI00210A9CDB|nr:hypothetical protein [Massilia sp. YIM B04103]